MAKKSTKIKPEDLELEEDQDIEEAAKAPSRKQLVHHVIRTISLSGGEEGGSWQIDRIESYLNDYLEAGWELMGQPSFIKDLPEGPVMLWTLVKWI